MGEGVEMTNNAIESDRGKHEFLSVETTASLLITFCDSDQWEVLADGNICERGIVDHDRACIVIKAAEAMPCKNTTCCTLDYTQQERNCFIFCPARPHLIAPRRVHSL